MSELDDRLLWIHGKYVEPATGDYFETINPASGEVICKVALAGSEDVERALESARQGQSEWGALGSAERGRILVRTANLLREHSDELARLESLDGGKPLAETPEADVGSAADCLEYFGGQAASLQGEYQAVPGGFFYTRPEPLGICAGIGAWNYPLQIAAWKAAPALAAGNAMVFKPAELTPLSALRLAELFKEAGLPDGVFNVVQGFAETGKSLTTHPAVAKVSLTGEVGTGKIVMKAAADSLKSVTLELGGKSPLIVFDDAHLDNAVGAAMLGNFYTQGQICTNSTRVFVHEKIKDAFVEKLVARTERLKLGDPLDPSTDVGPMISADHMQSVLNYLEKGKEEGGKVLVGGGRANVPGHEKGNFVQPTIFDGLSDDMTIVREEIFGPVLSLLSFADEEEVLKRANNTEFGLAGGVFTRDIQRAHRVAAAIEAGIVWINAYNLTPVEMPFGGFKQSGIGKENSRRAFEHYAKFKTVYVAEGDVDAPY
ncbi:NAD/NADP-dependent betaine aldehyde dehydrogenase [Microbulbifer aggregans]|uniref:Betaine-aldehyde dehydrogenase n=1 Tax=Microbulbifer aggregans TaxID=1769779 RepID=A0A1C9WA61_9GAMM|nr:betaine-aldehyde dehydrogenase [Microbulbifer aggregans]AOS98041.1 NAD/NADP-dependent betaine aldehyde dehydrogenase [Microbulbifer aggregans]